MSDFRERWGPGLLLRSHPVVAAAAYAVTVVLPLFLLGAFAVRMQDDLDFGTSALGLAVSCFFASGAVTGVTFGRVVDRIGASSALRIGSGVAAVGALLLAMAGTWWMVAAGTIVAGFASATANIATNRLLVVRSRAGRQATGFGVKQGAIPLASLAAGAAVAGMGDAVSWRAAFLVSAGISTMMAAGVPRMRQRPVTAARPLRGGMNLRLLGVLAVVAALGGGTGNAFPLLVVDSFDSTGLSEAAGGIMLGIGSVTAAVVRLGAGVAIDRRKGNGRSTLTVLLALGATGFAVMSVAGSSLPVAIPVGVITFAGAWGWPGVLYYTVTRQPVPPAATTGVVFAGIMIGSIAGPSTLAVAADHLGYSGAWAIAAGAMAIAAGFAAASRRMDDAA